MEHLIPGLKDAIDRMEDELDKARQPDERKWRPGLKQAITHLKQRLYEAEFEAKRRRPGG